MARSVDTPSRPRVALQLILRGMPLPAALAVFATIVSRLQQGVNGIDLTLKPPILMDGIDSSSGIELSTCCAAFGDLPVTAGFTPSFVKMDIDSNVGAWQGENLKFLLLTVGTHVTNQCPISLQKFSSTDLHGSNHYTFEMLSLVDALRARMGDDSVCEAIMVPPPSNDHVAQIWGNTVDFLKPADWLPVRPVPSVFGVPGNMRIATNVSDPGNDPSPIDGQVRPPMDNLPACLHDNGIRPGLVAKALTDAHFNMSMPDPADVEIVNNLRVDTPHGVRMLPSRSWWLRWYCLQPDVSAHVYNSKYPCIGKVQMVNGKAPNEHTSRMPNAVTMCGERRYCANCTAVFKHLDRSFVESTMADTVLAMVANCVEHWADRPGPQPLVWGRPAGNMRTHVCKVTCSGM